MVEIVDGSVLREDVTKNAMGGTELLAYRLQQALPQSILDEVQIVLSRVRKLRDDKVRIFWAHDLPGDPESEFLMNQNNHDWFHGYVFVSNWQAQQYIARYKLPTEKCIVIHNGIYPIAQTIEKPKDKINLIYHTTPHRGLELLIPTFEKLCTEYKNIHLNVYSSFKLYGWESRDKNYKGLFDKINNHEQMTYHGCVSNDAIRRTLSKSHIFAYPCVWTETSCLSLMEAMSAGLLCIHPNNGALFETGGNVTYAYQWQKNDETHMNLLYNILRDVISDLSLDINYYKVPTSMSKIYADYVYDFKKMAAIWNAYLKNIINNTDDRKLHQELFIYGSE
jgi:glycosyltransferase involved in cell wall biosynthesis